MKGAAAVPCWWGVERCERFDAVTRFHLLERTLPSIHANLALEEALLRHLDEEDSGPLVRLWEFSETAVVLGASRSLHEEVHVAACRADGVPIGRRSSGGGTVLVGSGALNLAVFMPLRTAPELATVDGAHRYVLEWIAEALRSAGAGVAVLGSGDLVLGDRKVGGSAQRRVRNTVLVHTTILYDFPLTRMTRYLRTPKRQPAYRAGRSHEAFVTNLPLSRSALRSALLDSGLPWGRAEPAAWVPWSRLEDLLESQFANPAWIERF